MTYSLDVNRQRHTIAASGDTRLLTVLRTTWWLTGARFGCGHEMCGACVVLVDRRPVPACTPDLWQASGHAVVTIEGLAHGDELHPVQRAFLEEGALQCGYCTSGMILAAAALLERIPSPTDEQIREALAPHLCRCGVYLRAIRAIKRASR